MKKKRWLIGLLCACCLLPSCSLSAGEGHPVLEGRPAVSSAAETSSGSQGSERPEETSSGSKEEERSEETSSESREEERSDESENHSRKESAAAEVSIVESPTCLSAVAFCVEEGKMVYEDYPDLPVAPASMTKLLTASVMLQYFSPEEVITVGDEQYLVHEDSSLCFISIGSQLTVRQLLTGMLLCSGNDAAYTAAVATARRVRSGETLSDGEAVEVFVGLMNDMAASLGMTDSHFLTPDGWDEEGQFVTAADMVKAASYVLTVPELRRIVGTFETTEVFLTGETVTWNNTNSLLDPESPYYSSEAIGCKTGTTNLAGCCLSAAFLRDGKTYITVVTGCTSNEERFDLTLKILSKVTNSADE